MTDGYDLVKNYAFLMNLNLFLTLELPCSYIYLLNQIKIFK